jgi:hypothetical protein
MLSDGALSGSVKVSRSSPDQALSLPQSNRTEASYRSSKSSISFQTFIDQGGVVREAYGGSDYLRAERAQLQLDHLVLDCARISESKGRS